MLDLPETTVKNALRTLHASGMAFTTGRRWMMVSGPKGLRTVRMKVHCWRVYGQVGGAEHSGKATIEIGRAHV